MSKKNKPDSRGFVFSTDPNFKFEEEHHSDETLLPAQQKLKSFCGTGGSAKDGEIIIQGDQREKVMQWFGRNGYSNVKRINF